MPSSVSTIIFCAFCIVVSLWAITKVVLLLASFSRDSCTTFSLSLSSADVASSKISIGGFLRNTRAIDNLCFCPPDSFIPLCPMSVSYPSGNDIINSCALAFFAASITSSLVAPGFPYAILSIIVPANRYTSCCTIPI